MHVRKHARCIGALYRLEHNVACAKLDTEEERKKQAQRYVEINILQHKLGIQQTCVPS